MNKTGRQAIIWNNYGLGYRRISSDDPVTDD